MQCVHNQGSGWRALNGEQSESLYSVALLGEVVCSTRTCVGVGV